MLVLGFLGKRTGNSKSPSTRGGTLAFLLCGEIRVQHGEGLGWLNPTTSLGGVTCRLLRRNCIFWGVGGKLSVFQRSHDAVKAQLAQKALESS